MSGAQPPIANNGIAAQSFVYMELAPISSFDDASEKAEAARRAYPQALKMMLEGADWAFASKRVMLPQANLAPGTIAPPDMPFVYKRPHDLVTLQEVGEGRVHWELSLDYLRADDPGPLPVRYTAQISDETKLPAIFSNCVALQMAVLLSGVYVETQTKRDFLARELERSVMAAMKADARNASARDWQDRGRARDWVSEATR